MNQRMEEPDEPVIREWCAALFPNDLHAALTLSIFEKRQHDRDYLAEQGHADSRWFSASIERMAKSNFCGLISKYDVEGAVFDLIDRGYLKVKTVHPYDIDFIHDEHEWKLLKSEYRDDLEALGWTIHARVRRRAKSNEGEGGNEGSGKSHEPGHVYILSNPSLDQLKVGFTTRDPALRCDELSDQTGLPAPFEVESSVECERPRRVEQRAHEILDEHRTSDRREFFECSLAECQNAIHRAASDVAEGGAS